MSEIIGLFDTSVGSANVGDKIIMDACSHVLQDLLPQCMKLTFTSHDTLMYHSLKLQRTVAFNVLCGTNCISSNMMYRPSWSVNILNANFIKSVIPLGVGWGGYQGAPNAYTKKLLNKLFPHDAVLSVRDEYTRQKFQQAGFDNAINTGCPTIWGLTAEHCADIPSGKSSKVIFTFTDYAADSARDMAVLSILSANYEEVVFWLQGSGDKAYLESLQASYPEVFSKMRYSFIYPTLHAYDLYLSENSVDYVGTRLHGGIRALQHKKKTLIIAVDNRAIEMGRDFDLPVVRRGENEKIKTFINSHVVTKVKLDNVSIKKFCDSLITFYQHKAGV